MRFSRITVIRFIPALVLLKDNKTSAQPLLFVASGNTQDFSTTMFQAGPSDDYACLIQGTLDGSISVDVLDCSGGVEAAIGFEGGSVSSGNSGDKLLGNNDVGDGCRFTSDSNILGGNGDDIIDCMSNGGSGLLFEGSEFNMGNNNDQIKGESNGNGYGCQFKSDSTILGGNGNDIIDCMSNGGTGLLLEDSELDMGNNNDQIMGESMGDGYGCQIKSGSTILGGNNNDSIDCTSNSDTGLLLEGSELDMGNGSDQIKGESNGNGYGCQFTSDSTIFGGDGNDIIDCMSNGGTGLLLEDSELDMGDSNDQIMGESKGDGYGCQFTSDSNVVGGRDSDSMNCTSATGTGLLVEGSSIDLTSGTQNTVMGTSNGNGNGCRFINGTSIQGGGDATDFVLSCVSATSAGLVVKDKSIIDMGNSINQISAQGGESNGCNIRSDGEIRGGTGMDTVICDGGLGIQDAESKINLGSNTDKLNVPNGRCNVGGTIDFEDGNDEFVCAKRLSILPFGAVIMGEGDDMVEAQEGSIKISNDAILDLGDGNDEIKAMNGCVAGNVEMGPGDDRLIAKAMHGIIDGGDGNDCVQLDEGMYTLRCSPPMKNRGDHAERVLTLWTGHCGRQAGIVELISIERIGCSTTVDNVPECSSFSETKRFESWDVKVDADGSVSITSN